MLPNYEEGASTQQIASLPSQPNAHGISPLFFSLFSVVSQLCHVASGAFLLLRPSG